LLEGDGTLQAWLLDPGIEADLRTLIDGDVERMLEPGVELNQGVLLRRILDSLKQHMGSQSSMATPVLLCASPVRYHLRRWLEPFLPKLMVLSPLEIPSDVRLKTLGTVR
jgi:flagellar biosynthesis protein FlhA